MGWKAQHRAISIASREKRVLVASARRRRRWLGGGREGKFVSKTNRNCPYSGPDGLMVVWLGVSAAPGPSQNVHCGTLSGIGEGMVARVDKAPPDAPSQVSSGSGSPAMCVPKPPTQGPGDSLVVFGERSWQKQQGALELVLIRPMARRQPPTSNLRSSYLTQLSPAWRRLVAWPAAGLLAL